MSKEYIEREAFIKAKRKQYCADCDRRKGTKNGKTMFCYEIGDAPCRACSVDDMLDDVEDFPAADVVEVRHGHWITPEEAERLETYELSYTCSVCGALDWDCMESMCFNYCPNCGAKMDGGVNDAAD